MNDVLTAYFTVFPQSYLLLMFGYGTFALVIYSIYKTLR